MSHGRSWFRAGLVLELKIFRISLNFLHNVKVVAVTQKVLQDFLLLQKNIPSHYPEPYNSKKLIQIFYSG